MGVGRIDDDAAFFQNIDRYLNESTLGVDWIYLNQHMFTALPSVAGCPVKPVGPVGPVDPVQKENICFYFFNPPAAG
jgi:hypothetical protein